MRNIIAAATFVAATLAAPAAWANFCPVNGDGDPVPTAIWHNDSGYNAAVATCDEWVARAKARGIRLPTQAAFQAALATCGSGCAPWPRWQTLPVSATAAPAARPPKAAPVAKRTDDCPCR